MSNRFNDGPRASHKVAGSIIGEAAQSGQRPRAAPIVGGPAIERTAPIIEGATKREAVHRAARAGTALSGRLGKRGDA